MRYFFLWIAMTLMSSLTYAQQPQYFNDYSSLMTVKSVDFEYLVTAFNGTESTSGEIIIALVDDDLDGKMDVYKAAFIPSNDEIFPYVIAGFYAQKLIKIDLVNTDKVIDLLFTDSQWQEVIKANKSYVSKKGVVSVKNYATSVECDSRQYYAEITAFTLDFEEITMSDTRKEMHGC